VTGFANSNEDDGNGVGRLLGGQGGQCPCGGHDDVNLERNKFGRKSGEPIVLPCGISVLDQDVTALDVTEFTQTFEESLARRRGATSEVGRQVAYSSDLGRLLGLGGNRAEKPTENKQGAETEPHS
jgi:hypothetical protein